MTNLIILVACTLSVAGVIIFLSAAFQESPWWGLGCLLVPGVYVVFLVLHWQEARKGFLVSALALLVLVFVGAISDVPGMRLY
jgi:hypothetical protein